MCGRYTNTVSMQKLAERFGFKPISRQFPPRYNITPGEDLPVVLREKTNVLEFMRWGLVPSWAKDKKIGPKMINARAESLHQKPSFRRSFQKKRCLVPADGFYEWKQLGPGKGKRPYRVILKNHEPFAFAGLWDIWEDPQGSEHHSFTIVTTDANERLGPIHDRMPVILRREEEDLWLDPECHDPDRLRSLLKPYPAGEMLVYPVSTLVNSPQNDSPECIEEIPENEPH